jgi:phospholipid-translocating ATPase
MPGPAEATTSTSHLRPVSPHTTRRQDPHADDGLDRARDSADERDDDDTFDPFSIDPAYRLRTTKTAHSVIAESIRSEAAAEGRKKRRLFASMKRKATLNSSGSKFRFGPGSISGRKRSSTVTTAADSEYGASSIVPDSPKASIAPVLPILPPQTPPSDSATPTLKDKEKKDFFRRWFTPAARPPTRRTIFVNLPLPSEMLKNGEPITRYVRNKVRTSKYTLITFLPKNLFEQFRRVANIYFLALVILQLFSIFGAPNAQIGMLPLLFILGMTAIKDGIEDWRRASLDNEVNNSATTKLGGWRNNNQPHDARAWIEKLLGLGVAPGKTTKGVKKLRATEANAGKQIVMEQAKESQEELDSAGKSSYPLDSVPAVSRPTRQRAAILIYRSRSPKPRLR